MTNRRTLLAGLAAAPWLFPAPARADAGTVAALREGGVVVAFRHALAPGTFDPPEFRVDDCRTQRNLNDDGRAQARRIGEWFRAHGLQPAEVRSSPWCRCLDTARLAFGTAAPWAALGSPRGADAPTNAARLRELRMRVAEVSRGRGRFEAWVTHQFVLSDLAGTSTTSGEGLLLRADAGGAVSVLARLSPG